MTTQAHKADGVHRLVDMVVEEVSLVDRAANKHRFLIVKRDEAMDDDSTPLPTPTETHSPPAPAAKLDDNSALSAALAALESLTGLVELLGEFGADDAEEQLATLAEELRSVATQLLEGQSGEGGSQSKKATEACVKGAPATFAAGVSAAKQALSRLGALAKRVPAAADRPVEPPGAPATVAKDDGAGTSEALEKLAEAFRALSDTVKEQQQRLGRVEKQFGLPNSAPPAERPSKALVEDVGWPLDLNKPMDRESVDKATSFHEL